MRSVCEELMKATRRSHLSLERVPSSRHPPRELEQRVVAVLGHFAQVAEDMDLDSPVLLGAEEESAEEGDEEIEEEGEEAEP